MKTAVFFLLTGLLATHTARAECYELASPGLQSSDASDTARQQRQLRSIRRERLDELHRRREQLQDKLDDVDERIDGIDRSGGAAHATEVERLEQAVSKLEDDLRQRKWSVSGLELRRRSPRYEELRGLQLEISNLEHDKPLAISDLRKGRFCSECGRTATEIAPEPFEAHLERVGGDPVPATEEQIESKEAEFDQKIAAARGRVKALQDEDLRRQREYNRKVVEEARARADEDRSLQEQIESAKERLRAARRDQTRSVEVELLGLRQERSNLEEQLRGVYDQMRDVESRLDGSRNSTDGHDSVSRSDDRNPTQGRRSPATGLDTPEESAGHDPGRGATAIVRAVHNAAKDLYQTEGTSQELAFGTIQNGAKQALEDGFESRTTQMPLAVAKAAAWQASIAWLLSWETDVGDLARAKGLDVDENVVQMHALLMPWRNFNPNDPGGGIPAALEKVQQALDRAIDRIAGGLPDDFVVEDQ